MTDILQKDYVSFFQSLKDDIQSSRIRAVLAVNKELTLLYWRTYLAHLAQETGFSPSYLSRLENGSRKMSLEVAIKLCRFLDINLDDLIK